MKKTHWFSFELSYLQLKMGAWQLLVKVDAIADSWNANSGFRIVKRVGSPKIAKNLKMGQLTISGYGVG